MSIGNETAYPIAYEGFGQPYYGMTKREEFAKAAMQGMLAQSVGEAFYDPSYEFKTPKHPFFGKTAGQVAAEFAVGYADALLAELERGK